MNQFFIRGYYRFAIGIFIWSKILISGKRYKIHVGRVLRERETNQKGQRIWVYLSALHGTRENITGNFLVYWDWPYEGYNRAQRVRRDNYKIWLPNLDVWRYWTLRPAVKLFFSIWSFTYLTVLKRKLSFEITIGIISLIFVLRANAPNFKSH